MKFNLNIENINYIKFEYKDNSDFTHCVKAAIKRYNEQDIVAAIKNEEKLYIKTPQDILLSIASDNGLYKAQTLLKGVAQEDSYILFVIKTPEEFDYQQKREYFRVKINENANIAYNIGETQTQNLACETFDISANGVRLVIDEDIKFPESVVLKIYMQERTLEINAKYVRTDKEDKILKASFAFTDLKESDQDYIFQICFKKQLEVKRKGLM